MVEPNEKSGSNGNSADPPARAPIELASFQEVLSFGNGPQTKLLMAAGIIVAIVAGALGPFMIWYFARSFQDLSADPTSADFLANVKELAFAFLVLG